SQARLFREQADGRFVALGSFQHPKGRERSNTLVEAQRKEHLRFAAELADVLERAAREGSYASLRVFAASPFLAYLTQALGPATQRLLAGAHDIDLTHVGLAELQRRIQHELAQTH
ncbi:MAG: host attachment protein, partial [Ramlibacter sp.]